MVIMAPGRGSIIAANVKTLAPTSRCANPLSRESPTLVIGFQSGEALVRVVDGVHLVDRIEVADDEGRRERLARLDRAFAEFLDHADIAALVAPGFADHGRLECH